MTTGALQGKVVLITGPARGIGEQLAREAAVRGAKLVLVGLEAERLRALVDELGAERHAWFEADVTTQAHLDAAVAGALDRFGRIDVVVANAGIASRGTMLAGDIEAMAKSIEVNLIGVMRTAFATADALVASRGYLLAISSAAAFVGIPGMAAYAAAKAGVENLMNVVRGELYFRGVDVGSAHPSWIDTDMVRDVHSDLPTFTKALQAMPWPLSSTTSVEQCVTAIADGIERRRSRIYVPWTVELVRWVRDIVATKLMMRLVVDPIASKLIPDIEKETLALGRGLSGNVPPELLRRAETAPPPAGAVPSATL